MIFRLKADVYLEAENLDDVFDKLGRYFSALHEDKDEPGIFVKGQIDINPEEIE